MISLVGYKYINQTANACYIKLFNLYADGNNDAPMNTVDERDNIKMTTAGGKGVVVDESLLAKLPAKRNTRRLLDGEQGLLNGRCRPTTRLKSSMAPFKNGSKGAGARGKVKAKTRKAKMKSQGRSGKNIDRKCQ